MPKPTELLCMLGSDKILSQPIKAASAWYPEASMSVARGELQEVPSLKTDKIARGKTYQCNLLLHIRRLASEMIYFVTESVLKWNSKHDSGWEISVAQSGDWGGHGVRIIGQYHFRGWLKDSSVGHEVQAAEEFWCVHSQATPLQKSTCLAHNLLSP